MGKQPTAEKLLEWSHITKTIARRAGSLVQSMQEQALTTNDETKKSLEINEKSNLTDLVTRADLASQNLIFTALRANESTKSHRLIGEEDGEEYDALNDEPTWIVDAIDGTTNYVHGIRDYAISIAFSMNKTVMIGVVYSPLNNELFHAVHNVGSYLNDVPIHVSGRNNLNECLIISEWGYVRDLKGVQSMLKVNQNLMTHPVRGIRQIGSGSLDICYVGMGRVDGVYCGILSDSADAWKIWDYAAASLIAQLAGATMKTVSGDEFSIEGRSMVCTTPRIMDDLLKIIKTST